MSDESQSYSRLGTGPQMRVTGSSLEPHRHSEYRRRCPEPWGQSLVSCQWAANFELESDSPESETWMMILLSLHTNRDSLASRNIISIRNRY